MKTSKERTERIEWYLGFIQTNLEKLTEKEREAFQSDFAARFGNHEISFAEVERYQRHIKRNFELLISDLKFDGRADLGELSLQVKAEVDEEGKIDAGMFTPTLDVQMSYELLEALDGTRVTAFKRCPECKRHFFHPYKYERIYCSRHCGMRHINREKRKPSIKGRRVIPRR